MGRTAGGSKVYGGGLLKDGCPDFIKIELNYNQLSYLSDGENSSGSFTKIVDISLLSREAQLYLKMVEICVDDGSTSTLADAHQLSSFLEVFCETYVEDLTNIKSFILGKAFMLNEYKDMSSIPEYGLNAVELVVRAEIKTLMDFITPLLTNLHKKYFNPSTQKEVVEA